MARASIVKLAKRASTRIAGEIGLKNIHRSPKGSQLRKDAAKYVSNTKYLIKGSLGAYRLRKSKTKNPGPRMNASNGRYTGR